MLSHHFTYSINQTIHSISSIFIFYCSLHRPITSPPICCITSHQTSHHKPDLLPSRLHTRLVLVGRCHQQPKRFSPKLCAWSFLDSFSLPQNTKAIHQTWLAVNHRTIRTFHPATEHQRETIRGSMKEIPEQQRCKRYVHVSALSSLPTPDRSCSPCASSVKAHDTLCHWRRCARLPKPRNIGIILLIHLLRLRCAQPLIVSV